MRRLDHPGEVGRAVAAMMARVEAGGTLAEAELDLLGTVTDDRKRALAEMKKADRLSSLILAKILPQYRDMRIGEALRLSLQGGHAA
jgi:hypothetical protein